MMTLDPMRPTSPIMEEDHLRSGLSGKTNFSRPYTAKSSVQNLKGTHSLKGLRTGDAKATFNQTALFIGIRNVDNFNKILLEMTKHVFPAYAFREQKKNLHRRIVKPRRMKICSFISRLQELNAYLEEFPSDTEDQETASLPPDEIMDIIYHSMQTTWKNKMIEQGFNYADSTIKEMTDFYETRLEN